MSMSKELHTSIRIVDCCNSAGKPHLSLFHKFGGSTTKYKLVMNQGPIIVQACSWAVRRQSFAKNWIPILMQKSSCASTPLFCNSCLHEQTLYWKTGSFRQMYLPQQNCVFYIQSANIFRCIVCIMQDGTVTIALQWCTMLEPLRFSLGQMYLDKMRANFSNVQHFSVSLRKNVKDTSASQEGHQIFSVIWMLAQLQLSSIFYVLPKAVTSKQAKKAKILADYLRPWRKAHAQERSRWIGSWERHNCPTWHSGPIPSPQSRIWVSWTFASPCAVASMHLSSSSFSWF